MQISVAVGVVQNKDGDYLISKRHDHLHQGGLWEFPGGKLEPNETTYKALCRELFEELGIQVKQAKPLVKISHQYPDKNVVLNVWIVNQFEGCAQSLQGQPIKWVSLHELCNYDFPEANQTILNRLLLPSIYAITGSFETNFEYISKFKTCLSQGIKLIQLRYHGDEETLLDLTKQSKVLCEKDNARLLVNADVDFLDKCNVDGVHLNSKRLFNYSKRPIDKNKLLAVSVHNEVELQQAHLLEADFIVISPVLKTSSHPDAKTLGWDIFKDLADQSSIPAFALGGMTTSMLQQAKISNAQGIAAISEFWK